MTKIVGYVSEVLEEPEANTWQESDKVWERRIVGVIVVYKYAARRQEEEGERGEEVKRKSKVTGRSSEETR